MYKHTNKYTNKQTHGQTLEQTHEQIHEQIHEQNTRANAKGTLFYQYKMRGTLSPILDNLQRTEVQTTECILLF